jgi:hypothetical protein
MKLFILELTQMRKKITSSQMVTLISYFSEMRLLNLNPNNLRDRKLSHKLQSLKRLIDGKMRPQLKWNSQRGLQQEEVKNGTLKNLAKW